LQQAATEHKGATVADEGSGMPVMGNDPMVIGCHKHVTMNSTVTPRAIRVPKRPLARPAMRMPLKKRAQTGENRDASQEHEFFEKLTEKINRCARWSAAGNRAGLRALLPALAE